MMRGAMHDGTMRCIMCNAVRSGAGHDGVG